MTVTLSYNRLIDYLISLYLYMEFYTYGNWKMEWNRRCMECIRPTLEWVRLFGGRGKSQERKLEIYGGLDKEKKKRVVKLICMVKGQKFEEKKEVEDFTISVDDIDLVLERAKKLRPKLYMEMTNEWV